TTSIDADEALADRLAAETQEQDPLAHDRLALCLGQLREEYRTAIMMAYVNGYSYEQLSGRLDRPVGTLKTWVRRGLIDLRSCME
ncbi:sigma factor-like helix-turn-helix DNA-binding protein, partial [Klebsiella pneumoniae]